MLSGLSGGCRPGESISVRDSVCRTLEQVTWLTGAVTVVIDLGLVEFGDRLCADGGDSQNSSEERSGELHL